MRRMLVTEIHWWLISDRNGASGKHKRMKAVQMGDPRVNLMGRAFDVEARNKLWVGNIACIGTGEG